MDRDYADWFPSLGLSIALGKVQLSGNYGVDITRPSFANLSDNIIYINRYSYQGGNSKLKPTYSRDLSLSASWKWLWAQAIYSCHFPYAIYFLCKLYAKIQFLFYNMMRNGVFS